MKLAGEQTVVFCIVCFAQHNEHPPAREDEFNGRLVDGVWARDYTYHKDYFHGRYGVICNDHDRDEISERKMKDFDNDYKNNNHSL